MTVEKGRGQEQIKAISLFSGGLDSIMATIMMKEQGFEVIGVYLDNGFNQGDKTEYLAKMEKQLGITIIKVDISEQFTNNILFKPVHGYGKGLNPCVDCHANFIKVGWKYAEELGASFIFSGEVVGQRGMSQTQTQMEKVDNEIGYIKKFYLRPLSAKLLEPTQLEKNGWIDREKLLSISGRNRKIQMDFVKERGIIDYESPAGGCLLTQSDFAKRMRLIRKHPNNIQRTYSDYEKLKKAGRFFKIKGYSLFVSRNEKEGEYILGLDKKNLSNFKTIISTMDKSPVALIDKDAPLEIIEIATRIMSVYSKSENKKLGKFLVPCDKYDFIYNPLERDELEKYLIR